MAHAGRKCEAEDERIIAPSFIAFSDEYRLPDEITKGETKNGTAMYFTMCPLFIIFV